MAATTALALGGVGFASELKISVETEPGNPEFGWVYVSGMDRDFLAQLREDTPEIYVWRRMFSVRLMAQSPDLKAEDLPNIAGKYEIVETGLRFVPRFPPTHGLTYQVSLQFDGHQPASGMFAFKDAAQPISATPEVEAIYPSATSVPENTLRLYVHFSRPMQRGQVAEKIHLLDEDANVVPDAFILGPLGELWDRDQRRLTLLFDPGRIKRGVGPNRKMGPAMETGGQRTLVVDGNFLDATGTPIGVEYRRTYDIGAAIRDAVSPQRWIMDAPASGSLEPLRLRFTRSLDRGMLMRAIGVFDVNGAEIEGHIIVSAGETEWLFTPTAPWSAANHTVRISNILEDVSGNNVLAPMDVAIRDMPTASTTKSASVTTEIGFTPIAPGN